MEPRARLTALLFSLVMASLLLAVLVELARTGTVQAGSCDVPTGSHLTIQSAVDDVSCETINVAAGTFHENVAITRSIAIQGHGHGNTIVDGQGVGSVFTVLGEVEVVLDGMTIRSGRSEDGGGVYHSGGRLAISNAEIFDNTAANAGGGAFSAFSGTLTIENSMVVSNSSEFGGGGIFGFQVSVTNSTLISNTSEWGGGIYAAAGKSAFSGSEIVNNSGTMGGGIFVGIFGDLAIDRSVLSGNFAYYGGGIDNAGDTLTVTNSTLYLNTARYWGGGIGNFNAQAIVSNSTLHDNVAFDRGNGIYNEIGTMYLSNNTIAGEGQFSDAKFAIHNKEGSITLVNNTITGEGILNNVWIGSGDGLTVTNTIIANSVFGLECFGDAIISLGHNLDSGNTCNLTAGGDLPNTDPMLGPLEFNGGWTETHALLEGSPAIGAGDGTVCPDTDQRGYGRNGICDIGAYEFDGVPSEPVYLPAVLLQ